MAEPWFRYVRCCFVNLADTAHRRWPDGGEAVVAENDASAFFQPAADWLSFRPDLAATLQWTPDPSRPGRWKNRERSLGGRDDLVGRWMVGPQ